MRRRILNCELAPAGLQQCIGSIGAGPARGVQTQQTMQPLSDQQLWALDTQGYAVIRNALTASELATLAADPSSLADHAAVQRAAVNLCGSTETHAGRLVADTAPRVDRAPWVLRTVDVPTPLIGGEGRLSDLSRAYVHLHGWDRWDGHNAGRCKSTTEADI